MRNKWIWMMLLSLMASVAFPQQSSTRAKGKAANRQDRTGYRQSTEPDTVANDAAKQNDGRADYRSNEVSGNPNNRNINEGSNRENAGEDFDENGESSAADTEDGTGNRASPSKSNVPPVNEQSTSESGSPAMLSEEDGAERDGTNNVQRATPNMAGSPVDGIKTGKRSVGTTTRQSAPGQKAKTRVERPTTRQTTTAPINEQPVQQENKSGVSKDESPEELKKPADNRKESKKSKRKKRRNRN